MASKIFLLQVIATAEKYSFHNEYFQAELLLYRNHSIRISVKEFGEKDGKVAKTNRLRASINEAMILYYSISNLLFNQALKPEERQEIRKTIDKIKTISEESGHPQINKRYYLSEIYYYQVANQDKEALKFSHLYLKLVEEDGSQSSEQELAVAYGQLAQVNLRIGELVDAKCMPIKL